jgi:hypothetical protein
MNIITPICGLLDKIALPERLDDNKLPHTSTNGRQTEDCLPSTYTFTHNPTGRRHSLPFKKKVGSEG